MFKAVPFKSKPVHEKNIMNFMREIQNIPQLKELGGNMNLEQLGITIDEANVTGTSRKEDYLHTT